LKISQIFKKIKFNQLIFDKPIKPDPTRLVVFAKTNLVAESMPPPPTTVPSLFGSGRWFTAAAHDAIVRTQTGSRALWWIAGRV
jgi:hypothetical protein